MKKHLFTLVIITATSVPPTETPTSVPSPAPTEKPYEKVGDVPYADQDSRQKLDIYLPTSGEEPFPTLLAFHEGNFNVSSQYLGAVAHFRSKPPSRGRLRRGLFRESAPGTG
ncbi:MAG: hypothetical protein B6I35_01330, partial [Anaerolineaceae bacterium 4572_32.2]